MCPSEQLDESTRTEWRELGFFYDFDEPTATWRFVGSRDGLSRLADLLRAYASDERHSAISEHDHFGPYWYLKIATWHEPLVSDDGIGGTPADIARLAALVDTKLQVTSPGDRVELTSDYVPGSAVRMVLEVCEAGFDPSTADPLLSTRPPN